ncbi:uncharacterized protein B0H18DRAFT_1116613 [Fomitopsis serialis]|uniref:uncharacterized protein n=1 Tax=Fomitopsis serialis TaxID=139415 RepID=UPI002007E100|nr:uncharacterized protein B0H18DRAFT_1116613 [Neoantrodia serialis]KAH9930907.1 hypothetical protein B0H18DRAFT_1116613 [Neoantrodia serialis]
MEVDMSAPTDTFRVTRAKGRARPRPRARASDPAFKRPSLGGACIAIPAARSRGGSEDWVVQTRGLSIDGPLAAHPARLGEVREVVAPGAEAGREGGQMMDATMADEDVAMACSPPRPRLGIDAHSEPAVLPLVDSALQGQGLPAASAASPDVRMAASQSHEASMPSRRQRFTMGPRADCEKCRLGVKGHWMHFD